MKSHFGFTYDIIHERNGVELSRERVKNIIPTEGLNHLIDSAVCAGTRYTAWYVALFESNSTPAAGDTIASYTECQAFDEPTRPAFTPAAVSAGGTNNSAAKAEFTINATKAIYGTTIVSGSAKGSTSGVLLSAVRFASVKNVVDGDLLKISASVDLDAAA